MPNVQDIMEMADLLKVKAVVAEEDRCVVVRNRNATCTKCVDACIASCISVSRNEISIDHSACVDCGACTTVCPTNALHGLEPTSAQLAGAIAESADAASGLAVVACSRKASKHEADIEKFAEVPCLAHVDEALMLDCAAAGLTDIVLVDGHCDTCKFGAASVAIDASVDNAIDLLEASRSDAIITRTSEFPEEIRVVPGSRKSFRGEDRRGLLSQTGGYMRHVVTNVARKTIDDKLGKDKPKTLRDRLSAGQSGRMPTFEPKRNFEILEAMTRSLVASGIDALAPADRDAAAAHYLHSATLDTRHFGAIAIETEKCSGCGLCVLFCPTEALSHSPYEETGNEDTKYLEFDASLCTQCRLCEDVCIRRCLKVSPRVSLDALFDLEPELLTIKRPENSVSIFDLDRSRDQRKKS